MMFGAPLGPLGPVGRSRPADLWVLVTVVLVAAVVGVLMGGLIVMAAGT